MARYFFHLYNDVHTSDEEGQQFADAEAAIAHARSEAVAMAAASVVDHRHLILEHRVVVTDEVGAEVAVVRFGDVISVQPEPPTG